MGETDRERLLKRVEWSSMNIRNLVNAQNEQIVINTSKNNDQFNNLQVVISGNLVKIKTFTNEVRGRCYSEKNKKLSYF